MAEYVPLEIPDNPKLAQNIIHFGRALRRAGLPIGPGRVIDAIDAVKAAGFTNQQDFYWTLHACFVNRPEHRAVFAQIFRLYWRDPRYLEHMMSMMLPAVRGVQEERAAQAAEKRAAEALLDGMQPDMPKPEEDEENEETMVEVDASFVTQPPAYQPASAPIHHDHRAPKSHLPNLPKMQPNATRESYLHMGALP